MLQAEQHTVAVASPEDVRVCWRIADAHSLRPRGRGSSQQGFVAPTPIARYRELQRTAVMRVVWEPPGVVGFAAVLPPSHPELRSFFSVRSRFVLHDEALFRMRNLAWIVTAAIDIEWAKRGEGSLLYSSLLHAEPTWSFVALCQEEPVFNLAASRFHERMGFVRIGRYVHGVNGDGGSPVETSGVFLRQRSSG